MVSPEWPRKESKNQLSPDFVVTNMLKMTKPPNFAIAKLSEGA